MADTLNLPRTAEALEAYDAKKAEWDALLASEAPFETLWNHINEEERLAKEVGRAFGLDTADRNNLATCEALVRPDPGLRRMVAEWRSGVTGG